MGRFLKFFLKFLKSIFLSPAYVVFMQLPGESEPISHRWDLFEKAPQLVESRFTDMQKFAVNGFNMAMTAIQALSRIGLELKMINRAIAIDTEVIDTSGLTDRVAPTIDFNLFRIDVPVTPSQPTLIDATLEPIPGTFPEMVGPSDVDIGAQGYVSSLLSALKSKLLSDLQNGSIGLTPQVEDAIFKREYERSLIELEDEKDRKAANWARGGFPFPNGGLTATLDDTDTKFTDKRLDMSREVAIKSFELALQNSHFIIAQGISIEGMLIQWTNQVATRVLEGSKAIIDSQIRSYDARVRGFGERARIIIEKCKAKIEYNIGLIRMYEASVNAYAAKMRAESERVNAVATGYEAETTVFNTQVNFDVKKIDVALEIIKARIEQAVANANIMIKDKEVEIKQYEMLNSLLMEAQKAQGEIAAQVAAGALAAVHASVSIGSSDSASYSYSSSTSTSTTTSKSTTTTGT
jgi:hypothetical protein